MPTAISRLPYDLVHISPIVMWRKDHSASCCGSVSLTQVVQDEKREDCWQIQDFSFIRV